MSDNRGLAKVLCSAGIGLATGLAGAAPITFTATVGSRSASSTFEVAGNDLVVTLTNTSPSDALFPVDILTAVFWDVTGPAINLTPVSAVLNTGSVVHFGGTDPGGVVGGEWAYSGVLVGEPAGNDYGISSVGLGLFGPGDLFPGNNLQGPESPDGLQYGITTAGDNVATGNTPVTGANALIQNSVVLRLSGLPDGFDPATRIGNVIWQYGTDLSDPRIPEPTSLALLALGSLLAIRRR